MILMRCASARRVLCRTEQRAARAVRDRRAPPPPNRARPPRLPREFCQSACRHTTLVRALPRMPASPPFWEQPHSAKRLRPSQLMLVVSRSNSSSGGGGGGGAAAAHIISTRAHGHHQGRGHCNFRSSHDDPPQPRWAIIQPSRTPLDFPGAAKIRVRTDRPREVRVLEVIFCSTRRERGRVQSCCLPRE